jgi:ABC-type methionine transport system permease subunit
MVPFMAFFIKDIFCLFFLSLCALSLELFYQSINSALKSLRFFFFMVWVGVFHKGIVSKSIGKKHKIVELLLGDGKVE